MNNVKLGDIFEYLPKSKLKAGEGKKTGKYKFFTSSNMQNKYIDKFIYEGECLIFGTGGKASINYCNEKFSTSTDNLVVKVNKEFNTKLIYLYFKNDMSKLENGFKGASIKHISKEYINQLYIPKYNLKVQADIVKKLNKLQKIIDIRKKQIEELDKLIKSQFIEMFGNPITNERQWKKVELQDLVTSDCTISYGIVQTGAEVNDGVPVFRPIDIVNNIPKLETLKRTSKDISERYKKTILQGNELLITVRANIGDTYIIDESFKGCNVGRGITPLRFNNEYIEKIFMKVQLDNEEMKYEMRKKSKGIVLLQLNMEDLRKLRLIVPPIELQNQFAGIVKQIDKQKIKMQKSLKEMQLLQESLMNKYFAI